MPILRVLKAKYDFTGTSKTELSFKIGATIYLFLEDPNGTGWAKGGLTSGEKGWFPIKYCVDDPETQVPSDEPRSKGGSEIINNSQPQASIPEHLEPQKKKDRKSKREKKEKEKEKTKVNEESLKERHQIAFEILTTERTYIKNLITVIKYFLSPMRETKILDQKDIAKIFSNLEKIHGLNSKIHIDLEKKLESWGNQTTIADVFLNFMQEFDLYSEYLLNHHNAIVLVNQLKDNKKIGQFLQSAKEQKECEGLDLLSFLIMPVQRILRYKLLLEDLNKKTPTTHPDSEGLSEVLEKISVLAHDVNNALKKEENYEKLLRIQKNFVGNLKNIVVENRVFIKEGSLLKVCRKENKLRHFFLFSDVLVYASTVTGNSRQSTAVTSMERMTNPNAGGLVGVKFLFHRMLDLSKTRVKDLEDTTTQKNAFQIITTEEKSFTVIANDVDTKLAWFKAIQKQTEHDENMDEAAPVWLPDKDAKQCMICSIKFTTFNRRHHCRYCGRVICGNCSGKKIKLPSTKSAVRVCDTCHKDLKLGSSASLRSSSSLRESEISTSMDNSIDKYRSGESSKPSSISSAHGRTILRQFSGTFLTPVSTLGKDTSMTSGGSPASNNTASQIEVPEPLKLNQQLPIHDQMERLLQMLNDERNQRIAQENLFKEEILSLHQENQQLREIISKLGK